MCIYIYKAWKHKRQMAGKQGNVCDGQRGNVLCKELLDEGPKRLTKEPKRQFVKGI